MAQFRRHGITVTTQQVTSVNGIDNLLPISILRHQCYHLLYT
jgi:hypothetical protein